MKFGRSPEILEPTRRFGGNPKGMHTESESVRSILCIREMATALVLARTGVEFDEGVIEDICANVASVAEEFGWAPEYLQQILEMHEPTLAAQNHK